MCKGGPRPRLHFGTLSRSCRRALEAVEVVAAALALGLGLFQREPLGLVSDVVADAESADQFILCSMVTFMCPSLVRTVEVSKFMAHAPSFPLQFKDAVFQGSPSYIARILCSKPPEAENRSSSTIISF